MNKYFTPGADTDVKLGSLTVPQLPQDACPIIRMTQRHLQFTHEDGTLEEQDSQFYS
jgi:hypothetical protein